MNLLAYFLKGSAAFSRRSPWVVLLAAVLAWFVPASFAWVQQGDRPSYLLGAIMLTMGCTLQPRDFRILLQRPGDILLGTLAQFTVMPCVALLLTHVFSLNTYLAAGIILVGCCPGGVSSNIMSYLCKGDVAFSVGMTTTSTLLAPLATPLLMLYLAGSRVEVDAWGMFQGICLVTLMPVALGLLFNYTLGKFPSFQRVREVMPGLSVLCLACIVGGVVYTVHPRIAEGGTGVALLTLAVVVCHNGLGYLVGYAVGVLAHFSVPKRRTISIEVGMQNAGMATVLASAFLAPDSVLATTPEAALAIIPCALSCAYHSLSGTWLAAFFVWGDKKKEA